MQKALAVFAILLAHGCTPSFADPRPPQATETRRTGEFRGIDITGTLSVEAKIGPATSVVVRGDADRIKQVTTTVKNGVLVLGTTGKLENVKRLEVIVTAPELTSLAVTGTGELAVSGISTSKLALAIPGTGNVRLSGKATSFALAVDGTGNVEAKDLATEAASVRVSGTAQAKLHATRTLDATISGTAVLEVQGKPTIRKSVTGTAVIDDGR